MPSMQLLSSCHLSWTSILGPELGNSGWDWDSLEPYFRKFHTLSAPSQPDNDYPLNFPQRQSTSGPIQASFPENVSSTTKAWNETFRNLDYPFKGDVARGQVIGPYLSPASIDPVTKQRSYSASAYLHPIMDRSNLKVLTGAEALKVNFSGQSPTVVATGVDFLLDGKVRVANTRKEIILAAGTIQSPKILELSGISSGSLLQSHEIPIVIGNSNVGEKLQDHLMCGISYEVADGIETLDDLVRGVPTTVQAAMNAYTTSSSGPLARASVNTNAFVPIIDAYSTAGEKSMQTFLAQHPAQSGDLPHHKFCRSVVESKTEGSAQFLMVDAQSLEGQLLTGNFITLIAVLMHPLSVGNVHMTSGQPAEQPIIDPKYLSNELDMEVLARHVMSLNLVAGTKPLAGLLKTGGKRNALYEDMCGEGTLEQIKGYVRKRALSQWHPVGTCAMLPEEKGGVVDKKLRVYGTTNLRVVDASIMPTIPRANTQTTVYAIAEKAADLIKESL